MTHEEAYQFASIAIKNLRDEIGNTLDYMETVTQALGSRNSLESREAFAVVVTLLNTDTALLRQKDVFDGMADRARMLREERGE